MEAPAGGNVPAGAPAGGAAAAPAPAPCSSRQLLPAGGNVPAGGRGRRQPPAPSGAAPAGEISRSKAAERQPIGAGGGVTADQLGGIDPSKLDTLNKDDLGNLSMQRWEHLTKTKSLTSIPMP